MIDSMHELIIYVQLFKILWVVALSSVDKIVEQIAINHLSHVPLNFPLDVE
jgi:hypothetical protein